MNLAASILTSDDIMAAEHAAAENGVSPWELMQSAGRVVATQVHADSPEGWITVLCGPGNNGGDGYVIAAELAANGRDVIVLEWPEASRKSPAAQNASKMWTGERIPLDQLHLRSGDIVVDALFGLGLSRPLEGLAAKTVDAVNKAGVRVIAVDIPSGLSADTGKSIGPAIRAHKTITFAAHKPVHVLAPAMANCGDVLVEEIGFEKYLSKSISTAELNEPTYWQPDFPWPGNDAHKYKRGSLVVVSGNREATGAARLAARAGLRVGAGVVTLVCPPDALDIIAASERAVMTKSFTTTQDLADKCNRANVVVIGPAAGVTEQTKQNIEQLGQLDCGLVVDADGLTVFAGDIGAMKAALNANAILTPHIGEFERLFPNLLNETPNKIEATKTAAAQLDAIIVLKGPDTVIAHPDGRAVVNTHASPFLATAGSGDVLAGVIGGLWAQGMPAFQAACAGVGIHGDAGLRSGPGTTAEDLDQAIKQTLAALYETRTL